MTPYEYSLIVCAAFTLALTAFPSHAEIKGWRVGQLFAPPAQKITLVSALISIGLILHVLAEIVRGGLSWWWLLTLPAAYFIGGLLVTSILGRSTGAVSLIVAPASFAVASYLWAT